MTTPRTSRVFDAMQALYDRLAAQTYPSSSDGSPPPEVWFGDQPADLAREAVVIVGRVDEASSDWATFGIATRDEQMTFQVRFICEVPGRDGQTVLARMGEVCDVIQTSMRNVTTGQPIGLGYDGEVLTLGVTRVDPQIGMDAEGWLGRTDLFVQTQARI